ncbi:DUF542 domain-containing protein [Sphingobacterium daejeonense]|uniref:DUF542 domain-containing protein n=1 Tax=Sphingobacterium daejeonense TaxID=371142 RepID=UPI0010C4BC38|nr:DUF542 domain-containing protein [Sphingobacterium daejeonense]VTQ04567.1 Cell wall-related protein ScdA [Sphingobacterium daejeonense]
MENLINEKIGNVVAQNFKTAAVFTKYGLDFCCGGQVSIEKAAEKKGIDKNALLTEVQAVFE